MIVPLVWIVATGLVAGIGWWLGVRLLGWLADRREQRRQAERQVVMALAELRMRAVDRAAIGQMVAAARQTAAGASWKSSYQRRWWS